MIPLLFTVRCCIDSGPIKAATPLTLMDNCYHLGHGTRRCPQHKGPGLAILFFGCQQEPQEGLYLHEAQELAEQMTKTTTWVGQSVHQQVFPITIAEAWCAISMSHGMSKHWDQEGPMEMIQ